ncbi:hypothetical protein AMECASPLE_021117 [Ameca splendens]|uniref:Uncharacterized protein n=1 Tax=Ameca splendens TaxID=208324 RepID=A0ABV0ZNA0_9TELE
MSIDSNHSLLHWTSLVGSLLNSSLLGLPLKNPVHPPPSTAPSSENPGPSYHSGTPLSTIIYLTGKQLFLWRIIPSSHWFPGSSFPAQVTTL